MGAADAFTPSQALLDIQSDAKVTGGITVDGSTLDVTVGTLAPRYMGVMPAVEHTCYVFTNRQSVIDHSQMRYMLCEWGIDAYGNVRVDPSVFRDNQGFFTLSARIELCHEYL